MTLRLPSPQTLYAQSAHTRLGAGRFSADQRQTQAAAKPGASRPIRREWHSGDRIELELPDSRRLESVDAAHPDTVALLAGPLVLMRILEADAAPAIRRDSLLARIATAAAGMSGRPRPRPEPAPSNSSPSSISTAKSTAPTRRFCRPDCRNVVSRCRRHSSSGAQQRAQPTPDADADADVGKLRGTIATAETAIVVEAGEHAPRLITLTFRGATPWKNARDETLPEQVESSSGSATGHMAPGPPREPLRIERSSNCVCLRLAAPQSGVALARAGGLWSDRTHCLRLKTKAMSRYGCRCSRVSVSTGRSSQSRRCNAFGSKRAPIRPPRKARIWMTCSGGDTLAGLIQHVRHP